MSTVGPSILVLPVVADLDSLDAVRDQITEMLDAAIVVDASGVERIATNALLMLLSAAQSATRNGGHLSLWRPSSQFLRATERLGLCGRFAPLIQG